MALKLQNVILKISAGEPRQIPSDPLAQVAFSGRSCESKLRAGQDHNHKLLRDRQEALPR